MTLTIRVRVNPHGTGEFAGPCRSRRHGTAMVRAGGAVVGWERDNNVSDWPEFELAIPELAGETP